MKKFPKLGATLDADNYEWLLNEYPALAVAVETEVLAGASPEALGRFMAQHIGEHRQALIARCVSAARHVGQQAR